MTDIAGIYNTIAAILKELIGLDICNMVALSMGSADNGRYSARMYIKEETTV